MSGLVSLLPATPTGRSDGFGRRCWQGRKEENEDNEKKEDRKKKEKDEEEVVGGLVAGQAGGGAWPASLVTDVGPDGAQFQGEENE